MTSSPGTRAMPVTTPESDDGRHTKGSDLEILPPVARGRSGRAIKLRPPIKLKLFVDRVQQKVVFAEIDKDAVDVLFSILGLPLGSLVGLLEKQSMVDCLDKLYNSLKSLDKFYVHANQKRTDLLSPWVDSLAMFTKVATLIWKVARSTSHPHLYYCLFCCRDGILESQYYSHCLGVTCPGCSKKMEKQMVYVPPPACGKQGTSRNGNDAEEVGGFVMGLVKYIVMDDLEVSPGSYYPISTLLKKLGVKDVNSLEVMKVDLHMSKAREMLIASLHSTTVLTDVFLPKNSKKLKRCRPETV